MIEKLLYWESPEVDPYLNLAAEEALLDRLNPGECALYLWQNQHTVVIGRNQNAWKECEVSLLEAEGGHLARRLSGGGAVYHDLGNLNFTFFASHQDYDVGRQLSVIIRALAWYGARAELSGRNDLLAEGRKCSGNAFYRRGGACCHHGTLLLDADMEKMSRYLTVDPAKLAAKGVASVRSRTVNLGSLIPGLTAEDLKAKLKEAFSLVYGLPVEASPGPEAEALGRLRKKYVSDKWLYGRQADFNYRFSRRFAWGDADISLRIKDGLVEDALISSDAMEVDWTGRVEKALLGRRFGSAPLWEALAELAEEGGIFKDIQELIQERGI